MRRALPALLAAFLVAGLAWAAATVPSSGPAAAVSSADEVEARALLARALEEVRPYGDGWQLAGVFAVETAEPAPWMSSAADPRPGNGLAPLWSYLWTGPAGQAYAAIKASGQRAAVGWSEQAHPWSPPPLAAWDLGSAEALARAREDPQVREALGWERLQLVLRLQNAPPAGVTMDHAPSREEQAGWDAWWSVDAMQRPAEAAEDPSPPQRALSFRIHAVTGALEVGAAQPGVEVLSPGQAGPPPEHHASFTSDGDVGTLRPSARLRIDPGGGGPGHAALDMAFEGQGLGPARLVLRVLDEALRPVAEVEGTSPLHLEAELPGGFAYAEVALPEGEASLGTTYHLAGVVRQAWPEGAAGSWSWGLGGSLDALRPREAHLVPLDAPVARLHAVLLADAAPVEGDLALRLLGPDGAVLAEAQGRPPLVLDAGGLEPGTLTFEVEALGAPPPLVPRGYTLDLQGYLAPSEPVPGGY